jgi:hypothetical protein
MANQPLHLLAKSIQGTVLGKVAQSTDKFRLRHTKLFAMLKIPADDDPIRWLEIVELSGKKQRNFPNKKIRKVGLRILLLDYFLIFKK